MIKTDMRREIGVVVHVGMNMSTFLFVSDPLAVRVLCCVARLAEPPLLLLSPSLPPLLAELPVVAPFFVSVSK